MFERTQQDAFWNTRNIAEVPKLLTDNYSSRLEKYNVFYIKKHAGIIKIEADGIKNTHQCFHFIYYQYICPIRQ